MSINVHNPYVPRLIAAACRLQELIDSNALFEGYDGDPAKAGHASAVVDEFTAAVGQVSQMEKLNRTSPFVRYRAEIMGGYSTAQRLASLVLHLFNCKWPADIHSLLWNADERHTAIALELLAWYARHGENDRDFMALAGEILKRDHGIDALGTR
ncbi:hypothetical protein [Denitromonas sp.]|uniref:hypothetical protein n=1 Tax=Denitromonas sp. TaxID=2734609 RepID=UPI003A850539